MDAGTTVDAGSQACAPVVPGCQDYTRAYLRLGTIPATGLVTNSKDGLDWITVVDGTRGGGGFTPRDAGTPVEVADGGAEAVDAGEDPVDAGEAPIDAGDAPVDAGDALDGGTGSEDGGSGGLDAGDEEDPVTDGGTTDGGQPRTSYVYARFDPDKGLEKLAIDDRTALASTDWDIAFRRLVVRVNSGDSGPSCVQATRTPPVYSFDQITISDAKEWRDDDFFTSDCSYIPDGSGLGNPGTVLSGYYKLTSCAEMTHNIYLVQLRNGRHVKLTVEAVYPEGDAARCGRGLQVGFQSAGRFQIRWSYID